MRLTNAHDNYRYKNTFNTRYRKIEMIWLMGGNNLRYLKYCTRIRSIIVLKKLSIKACLILVFTCSKKIFTEPQLKTNILVNRRLYCCGCVLCSFCSNWKLACNEKQSFQSQWSSVWWKHKHGTHISSVSNNLQNHSVVPQNRCYINVRTKQSLYSRQDFSAAAACWIKGGVLWSCTALFFWGRASQQV